MVLHSLGPTAAAPVRAAILPELPHSVRCASGRSSNDSLWAKSMEQGHGQQGLTEALKDTNGPAMIVRVVECQHAAVHTPQVLFSACMHSTAEESCIGAHKTKDRAAA